MRAHHEVLLEHAFPRLEELLGEGAGLEEATETGVVPAVARHGGVLVGRDEGTGELTDPRMAEDLTEEGGARLEDHDSLVEAVELVEIGDAGDGGPRCELNVGDGVVHDGGREAETSFF